MDEVTRYVRIQRSMEPLRTTDRTQVPRLRVVHALSVEEEFRASQRAMASAVREEPRRGLFVFAHHVRYGAIGRLWLEAGARPRAGTLGRHDAVDLALPLDQALSLRHALFIVREVKGAVRFTVLDLASTGGLDVALGHSLRRFDAEGSLAVRVADFVLFCVPTGGALPWDPEAADAWATFQRAPPTFTQLRDRPPRPPGRRRRTVGCLTASLGGLSRELRVTEGDLSRGVLVGREARCEVRLPEGKVSRVHAVLIRVDGALLVADAGSTNGLWTPEAQEVRCAAWGPEQPLHLGEEAKLEWSTAH